MKHLGDITLIDGSKIEPVDVITFGSPCQDLSIAGKRAGLAGQRSGLFMEAIRIIKQMQEATNGEYPKYAVWENVPGAFSSNKGKDFLAVLEELIRIKEPAISLPEPPKSKWSKAGGVSGSGWSLAWRTMDAQYWGVPQRRLRISLVLDLTGQRAGEILFEPESLRGHFAPSITPGQATAGAVENGAGTTNCTDAIIAKAYTLKNGSGVKQNCSFTLNTVDRHGVVYADGYLNYINPVCYAATTEPNMVICDDCSPAIRSRDYKDPNIVCYDARGNGDGMLSPTITGDHNSRITDYTAVVIEKIIRWIVRRLTPTECERLQGYPDGWTDLGEWVDSKGKVHKPADTPRYKALGNSIALPQWYYVLGGIADRLPDNATLGSLFDGIGGFPYVWAQLHAGRKELCVWASEIEEFPIAVTKVHFPES